MESGWKLNLSRCDNVCHKHLGASWLKREILPLCRFAALPLCRFAAIRLIQLLYFQASKTFCWRYADGMNFFGGQDVLC